MSFRDLAIAICQPPQVGLVHPRLVINIIRARLTGFDPQDADADALVLNAEPISQVSPAVYVTSIRFIDGVRYLITVEPQDRDAAGADQKAADLIERTRDRLTDARAMAAEPREMEALSLLRPGDCIYSITLSAPDGTVFQITVGPEPRRPAPETVPPAPLAPGGATRPEPSPPAPVAPLSRPIKETVH